MSDVKITLKEHGMEISGPAELMWPFVQRFLSGELIPQPVQVERKKFTKEEIQSLDVGRAENFVDPDDDDESYGEVGFWDILDEGQDAQLFIKSEIAARINHPSEAALIIIYAYHELSDVGWLTDKMLRASMRESGFRQKNLPDVLPRHCQTSYLKTKKTKHFRLTEAGRKKAGDIMQRIFNAEQTLDNPKHPV